MGFTLDDQRFKNLFDKDYLEDRLELSDQSDLITFVV